MIKETELDEAREEMLKFVPHEYGFSIQYNLRKHVHDDSSIEYIKDWEASCKIPAKGICDCCGKKDLKFFNVMWYESALDAAKALRIKVENNDYV